MDISIRFRLRLRTNEIGTGNKQTLQLCNHGRESNRILPIPKEILRTSRHTNNFLRKNRPNTRPPNTRLVGRHNYRNTRYNRTTHTKTGIRLNETRKRRIQTQQKEFKILPKRNNMVGTHHITRRNQTEQRKNGRHQQIGPTNKHQNTQIISRRDTIFRKIHTKPIQKNDNMRQLLKKGQNGNGLKNVTPISKI